MSKIYKPLTSIKRVAPEAMLANLLNEENSVSQAAAQKLMQDATSYDLPMRDYLRLAIDPTQSNRKDEFEGLNGYEAALLYLGLPVRNDFDSGVTLDLASDTFNTFPGTRAIFPEVIDDLVQWSYRQDSLETPGALVASSRTIAGVEMVTTVVPDTKEDYTNAVSIVPELSNIPVQAIRTTDHRVRMYKIGGGYRTSYEFQRRARLDLLTPYANRINRELERSKVGLATGLLINGDGVQSAAPVVNQSFYNGGVIGTATNGQLSFKHLLAWLVARAQAGRPVDTVVGNWGAYIQWIMLFALPQAGAVGPTAAEAMAKTGFNIGAVPLLRGAVNFAISSAAPDGQLIGYTKGETLEELIEAGSLIQEAQRAVNNQSISYYKTEVSGYRLVFADTRSIFNFAA